MLRSLFTVRWLLALFLAIAFAVACVLLGRWQWGRYEDRLVRAAAVTAHYTAAPVPLGSMTGRLPISEGEEWTRVIATGTYAGNEQLLVRNRALDSAPGLEVLVPFDAGGARVLVDRGWVPNPDSAAAAPAVPPVPGGQLTVEGWLRRGETDLGKSLPPGQLASINIEDARRQLGGDLLDTYLVLASEHTPSGVVPQRPAPLERPDTSLGPHQAYAFQWWLTSVFGFVLLGHRLRAARHLSPVSRPVSTTRSGAGDKDIPSRQRKVRIWDEEDG